MNNDQRMRHIQQIHLVGIGGVGMAGIAEVLLTLGYQVSGSDIKESATTKRLVNLGATVHIGHHMNNVTGADVVVVSTAVISDNEEIQAAKKARIPIVRRAEMLAELMRLQYGIAISGTHGKTTTTSLVASLLAEGGLDPTFVIGGLLNSAGSNGRLGIGKYFVAEADESDASFLYLKPTVAIVTNIDADHMETYGGSFARLQQTFVDFLQHLPFYGLAVLCIDDPVVREIQPHLSRSIITYGFADDADVRAVDFHQKGIKSYFKVLFKDGTPSFDVTLNLPGRHNVTNALAAIIVARDCGVDNKSIVSGLQKFAGIGRRFNIYGEYACGDGKITLVDDYGHHPNEIKATVAAARGAWPNNRIVLAFQPHRYTRTSDLFQDFVKVLADVDQLVMFDIYSAGEKPIPGITGSSLFAAIQKYKPDITPVFVEKNSLIEPVLQDILRPGDILLMQGAGDIGAIAARLAESKFKFLE